MQYNVLSPINYNGGKFKPGDTIDLPSGPDATKLLEGGVIECAHLPFSCGELSVKLNPRA